MAAAIGHCDRDLLGPLGDLDVVAGGREWGHHVVCGARIDQGQCKPPIDANWDGERRGYARWLWRLRTRRRRSCFMPPAAGLPPGAAVRCRRSRCCSGRTGCSQGACAGFACCDGSGCWPCVLSSEIVGQSASFLDLHGCGASDGLTPPPPPPPGFAVLGASGACHTLPCPGLAAV